MKAEILAWLRESDKFVSGQELCNRFGVSRTAVWKVINQLKKEGYRIEAVQNKGYHMVSSPDLLSKYELESRINTQCWGKRLCIKRLWILPMRRFLKNLQMSTLWCQIFFSTEHLQSSSQLTVRDF